MMRSSCPAKIHKKFCTAYFFVKIKRIFAAVFEKNTFFIYNWPRGGIGRRATLRGWCLRVCWFDSSRGHFTGLFRVLPGRVRFFCPPASASCRHFIFDKYTLVKDKCASYSQLIWFHQVRRGFHQVWPQGESSAPIFVAVFHF